MQKFGDMQFLPRPCPICNDESSRPIFTDINRREGLHVCGSLVECLHCGMRYLNPAPDLKDLSRLYHDGFVDPVYTDLSEITPVCRTPSNVSLMRSILHALNGLLRGHPHDWPEEIGKERAILDFGCHDGTKLIYWYQRGWKVFGIDLNKKAIEVARRRFPDGKFWHGDLPELHITERFDYIRTDNVVEHLLDPVGYLTALAKLLKPNGKLQVIVPNGRSLSTRLFGRYSYVYWMPFHLNLFNPKTLSLALTKAGLHPVVCSTFAPIGSWTYTQRQLLLSPGFNRRPPSRLEYILQRMSILNYPSETLVQWLGMGDEVFCVGMLPEHGAS
jgi:SAM-dependent methyltransferase